MLRHKFTKDKPFTFNLDSFILIIPGEVTQTGFFFIIIIKCDI